MTPNNSIDHTLLIRYLEDKDQLNADEQAQVNQWLQQNPKNRTELESLRNVWEQASLASLLKQVDSKADWPKTWAKMQSEAPQARVRQLPFYRQRVWQVAASVALLLLSVWGIKEFWQSAPSRLEYYTIVAQDSTTMVNLPDGSQVYLNENSRLSYTKDFGKGNRTVQLEGEGYFEVVSNSEAPFFVHTDPTTVRVVGTSFNVNSSGQAVKVTVNSGKVAFSHQKDTLLLTPDEVGIYQPGVALQELVNSDQNYLSWKTGVLRFNNIYLPQIAQDLERHYQVPIQLDDEALNHLRLTSTFQNQPLEAVLEEISMVLDIQYSHENNQILFFIAKP